MYFDIFVCITILMQLNQHVIQSHELYWEKKRFSPYYVLVRYVHRRINLQVASVAKVFRMSLSVFQDGII